ncbi:hypothetical protein [Vagococcus carniphilus]|uniref:hypothetical protein n=1 Tax=Vagococcus carniphilus TaxID=218144 RepID=UPI003B5B8AC2
MAFNITYDKKMAQYVVQSNGETKLIIRPHEKKKSWVGVEYDDMYDVSVNKDYTDMSNNELCIQES